MVLVAVAYKSDPCPDEALDSSRSVPGGLIPDEKHLPGRLRFDPLQKRGGVVGNLTVGASGGDLPVQMSSTRYRANSSSFSHDPDGFLLPDPSLDSPQRRGSFDFCIGGSIVTFLCLRSGPDRHVVDYDRSSWSRLRPRSSTHSRHPLLDRPSTTPAAPLGELNA